MPIFYKAFSALEKEFHAKYELSSTIRHRGEKGRQRENGLLTFLRDNLPAAYGVATGEIIPYKGETPSPQCDIIIYDILRMPILGRTSAVQQVPLEAVYAVIECKSVIDSTAIKDAQHKFDLIRKLPRVPSASRLKKDYLRGPHYIVFGYGFKTTVARCTEFATRHAGTEDTHVVALEKGCTIWVTDKELTSCVWLNGTEKSRPLYETLAIFYISLLASLQSVDLGNPNVVKMLFRV